MSALSAARQITPFSFVEDLAEDLSAERVHLPSFPDVALRIGELVKDPGCDSARLARAVGAEPALAAKLLRLANSALLRRGEKTVMDLRTAITRLGFELVRNAAVALATEQLMRARAQSHLRARLHAIWSHSVDTAAIAYVLARHATPISPDRAMLAALLHDVGKLYIVMRADAYPSLFDDHDAFDSVMQDWHTGIGRAILEAWHFDADVCAAADEHEILDRDHPGGPDMVDVVLAANVHAHMRAGDRERMRHLDDLPAWRRLNLDLPTSHKLLLESRVELQAIGQALKG